MSWFSFLAIQICVLPSVVLHWSVCVKVLFVGRRGSEFSFGWGARVSLDSASSECGRVPWYSFLAIQLGVQPPVERLLSVCLNTTRVVGDLSAASAVVLISLFGSPGSECGPVPWYSFLAIQLCVLPSAGVLISVCVKTYVGRQGSECSLGCGTHFSGRVRLI